jgi:hypothetical protein
MNIGQQQRLDSLRFYLYERPLHPELFDIYEDVRIRKPAYEVQLWVTGCTHVVSFFRDDKTLTEVIASEEIPLPSRGQALSMPFRGEKTHERKSLGGINYMMNFQTETMSPRVYHQTHHDLARQGARRGCFVPFPQWMSNSLTPFSFLSYDARPNELHLLAFHAFPEALTVVKTQSIFELG